MTDGPAGARSQELPRPVRVGYGAGSVATGAFGTVPGLMLLPYLTDTLGVTALVAGLVVLLPKAWDVVLNPLAGRISDRTVDPRGPRRPWLLRGGLVLAACFALLFAGPDLGSRVGDTAWVLVAFLACATAYAFFQVPFVAMPAELTDDYDERTRLMTWRVALLALTILLTGATAPLIRDAVGGRDGYRLMGLVMAVVIAVGVVAAYSGTRLAPVRAVEAGAGSLGDQVRVVAAARDFRALLTTFVVQALAVGAMLAGVDYVAREVLGSSGASTVLFVCFVGPALLLTVLLISFFTFVRIQDLRQELNHTGQLIANQLAPATEYGVISGNKDVLESLLTATLATPHVRFLEVQDSTDKVLVYVEQLEQSRSQSQQIEVFQAPVRLQRIALNNDFLQGASAPIGAPGEDYLGRVVVGMSSDAFSQRQQEILLKAAILALFALLFTFLVARRLASNLSRPIRDIGNAVKAVHGGG